MSLKEDILRDIDGTFMNEEDFCELHIVDGLEVPCIKDEEQLKNRQGTNELDVTDSNLLLFIPQKYLPKQKLKDEEMDVDGKIYRVNTWHNNCGIAEIALSRGVSK
jgi:hypothetical protein